MTIEEHWRELTTVALLGTDRREPPAAPGPIADLVADTAAAAPSERMLAQVAAVTAVRRAGVQPGPALGPLVTPPHDPRPPCVPAAVERWRHLVASWPVLEDEWMVTLIEQGWRLAPELLPELLARHRADAVRRARTMIAAGPLAPWLVDHVPALRARHPDATVAPEAVVTLPPLPIPPDLAQYLDGGGAAAGRALAAGLEAGAFGAAHRAVLVNLVARRSAAGLVELADTLHTVDPMAPGHGLGAALADLAVTRYRMLDDLSTPREGAEHRRSR